MTRDPRTPTVRPEPAARGVTAAAAAPRAGSPAPAPVRRRAAAARGQWAAWAFLAPVTAYLLAFYAWPLYRNLDLSLRDYTVRSFVQGDAPFTGADNYTKIFHDPTFGPALLHTVLFTGISLVFQ